MHSTETLIASAYAGTHSATILLVARLTAYSTVFQPESGLVNQARISTNVVA